MRLDVRLKAMISYFYVVKFWVPLGYHAGTYIWLKWSHKGVIYHNIENRDTEDVMAIMMPHFMICLITFSAKDTYPMDFQSPIKWMVPRTPFPSKHVIFEDTAHFQNPLFFYILIDISLMVPRMVPKIISSKSTHSQLSNALSNVFIA